MLSSGLIIKRLGYQNLGIFIDSQQVNMIHKGVDSRREI